MKKIIVVVTLVAVLGGGGYLAVMRISAQPAKAAENPSVAAPVRNSSRVQAVAKVVPAKRAQLSFGGAGTVAEVLVAEGDQVKAGQLLARLVSDKQAAAVAQAAAGLQQAEARLEDVQAGPRPAEIAAAQAAVDVAKAGLAKLKQGATAAEIAQAEAAVTRAQVALVGEQSKPSPSAQQLLVLKADLTSAQAQLQRLKQGPTDAEIAQAEANVRQAEANLTLTLAGPRSGDVAVAQAGVSAAQPQVDSARAALSDTEIRAPFDGTVAAVDLKVGEYVPPGTPVVQMADLSAWQIETEDLTEMRVVGIDAGKPVSIRFDALPGVTLTGTVSRVKPIGEKKQGDVLYTVVVKPEHLDPRVRWNMTANITFES